MTPTMMLSPLAPVAPTTELTPVKPTSSVSFKPDLLRYKGQRCVGSHMHTLLSYRGASITFTVEHGSLTVSITPRATQKFPAQEILDYLGFNTDQPVEESVIDRYGGGCSHYYRQRI